MVFPTVLFFLIFAYVPMYGVILAFKDFNYSLGIMNSPWNHFQNFRDVLGDPNFIHAFNNTLLISFGRLLIEFPIPILLAIMLNEMRNARLKRIYQTVFTFPHFISWVVLSGIITSILSDQGILNQILQLFGWGKNTILINNDSFLALLFTSNIWKEAGWSSIIYLAAIAGINPELYEAAAIDGANRYQQMKAVTWPVLRNTAAILLILAVGGIMNGGFDQIFNLYNPAVYDRSDILDTYVYRSAFVDSTGFGYSTTVGLLKSVINCLLLFGANFVVKHVMKEEGLY
jgi:putative aldouronate transport system permease protein